MVASSSKMRVRRVIAGVAVGGSLLVGAPVFTMAAHASTAIKAGAKCTKAQKGKTDKVGKTTYICKLVGKDYKWEVK
jgi:hypothetical protein